MTAQPSRIILCGSILHSSSCQVRHIPQSHNGCHIPVDAYGAPLLMGFPKLPKHASTSRSLLAAEQL